MKPELYNVEPSRDAVEVGWWSFFGLPVLVVRKRVVGTLPGTYRWGGWHIPDSAMRSRIACVLSEVHK